MMPWVVFVFVMGQMSISQIIRQIYKIPDTVIDYTGYDFLDSVHWQQRTNDVGTKVNGICMERLWWTSKYRGSDIFVLFWRQTLQPWQKERAIMAPPSLLDYFGYVFFFPSLMTGPAFDFAEYKRWVTLTMFDVKVPDPKSTTGGTKRRRKIPRSGLPATIKLAEGTFWLVGFALFSTWYTVEFALSDQFLEYSFLRRFSSLYPYW